MVGRLAIPYVTPSGIVQMRFRAIPEGGVIGNPENSPKYLSTSHASVTMFNTRDLLRQEECVAITEGEIDAITVHMAGIPAVGIPGSKNWQKIFARAFRYRKTLIFADNDDKGDGEQFAEQVHADIRGSRIVLMDPGYDVNKFVIEFGIAGLQKKVGINA